MQGKHRPTPGCAQMLITKNPSELNLTAQENGEIRDRGRWLRRVVNPFVNFYIILAVGAAGSPTTTEVARRHGEDKQVWDYAKDLYVPVVCTGHDFILVSLQHTDPTQSLY